MAIDLPATPPPDVPVRGETSALVRIPLSEVVASLSKALDLTEGQPLGHSVRACIIGMRLGQEIGLDEERLGALYYALLLKDAGCSSNASRMRAPENVVAVSAMYRPFWCPVWCGLLPKGMSRNSST